MFKINSFIFYIIYFNWNNNKLTNYLACIVLPFDFMPIFKKFYTSICHLLYISFFCDNIFLWNIFIISTISNQKIFYRLYSIFLMKGHILFLFLFLAMVLQVVLIFQEELHSKVSILKPIQETQKLE